MSVKYILLKLDCNIEFIKLFVSDLDLSSDMTSSHLISIILSKQNWRHNHAYKSIQIRLILRLKHFLTQLCYSSSKDEDCNDKRLSHIVQLKCCQMDGGSFIAMG